MRQTKNLTQLIILIRSDIIRLWSRVQLFNTTYLTRAASVDYQCWTCDDCVCVLMIQKMMMIQSLVMKCFYVSSSHCQQQPHHWQGGAGEPWLIVYTLHPELRPASLLSTRHSSARGSSCSPGSLWCPPPSCWPPSARDSASSAVNWAPPPPPDTQCH